jgi:hypothetical protein
MRARGECPTFHTPRRIKLRGNAKYEVPIPDHCLFANLRRFDIHSPRAFLATKADSLPRLEAVSNWLQLTQEAFSSVFFLNTIPRLGRTGIDEKQRMTPFELVARHVYHLETSEITALCIENFNQQTIAENWIKITESLEATKQYFKVVPVRPGDFLSLPTDSEQPEKVESILELHVLACCLGTEIILVHPTTNKRVLTTLSIGVRNAPSTIAIALLPQGISLLLAPPRYLRTPRTLELSKPLDKSRQRLLHTVVLPNNRRVHFLNAYPDALEFDRAAVLQTTAQCSFPAIDYNSDGRRGLLITTPQTERGDSSLVGHIIDSLVTETMPIQSQPSSSTTFARSYNPAQGDYFTAVASPDPDAPSSRRKVATFNQYRIHCKAKFDENKTETLFITSTHTAIKPMPLPDAGASGAEMQYNHAPIQSIAMSPYVYFKCFLSVVNAFLRSDNNLPFCFLHPNERPSDDTDFEKNKLYYHNNDHVWFSPACNECKSLYTNFPNPLAEWQNFNPNLSQYDDRTKLNRFRNEIEQRLKLLQTLKLFNIDAYHKTIDKAFDTFRYMTYHRHTIERNKRGDIEELYAYATINKYRADKGVPFGLESVPLYFPVASKYFIEYLQRNLLKHLNTDPHAIKLDTKRRVDGIAHRLEQIPIDCAVKLNNEIIEPPSAPEFQPDDTSIVTIHIPRDTTEAVFDASFFSPARITIPKEFDNEFLKTYTTSSHEILLAVTRTSTEKGSDFEMEELSIYKIPFGTSNLYDYEPLAREDTSSVFGTPVFVDDLQLIVVDAVEGAQGCLLHYYQFNSDYTALVRQGTVESETVPNKNEILTLLIHPTTHKYFIAYVDPDQLVEDFKSLANAQGGDAANNEQRIKVKQFEDKALFAKALFVVNKMPYGEILSPYTEIEPATIEIDQPEVIANDQKKTKVFRQAGIFRCLPQPLPKPTTRDLKLELAEMVPVLICGEFMNHLFTFKPIVESGSITRLQSYTPANRNSFLPSSILSYRSKMHYNIFMQHLQLLLEAMPYVVRQKVHFYVCDSSDAQFLEFIDYVYGTRFSSCTVRGVWASLRVVDDIAFVVVVFHLGSQGRPEEFVRQVTAVQEIAAQIDPQNKSNEDSTVKIVLLGRSLNLFESVLKPPSDKVTRMMIMQDTFIRSASMNSEFEPLVIPTRPSWNTDERIKDLDTKIARLLHLPISGNAKTAQKSSAQNIPKNVIPIIRDVVSLYATFYEFQKYPIKTILGMPFKPPSK